MTIPVEKIEKYEKEISRLISQLDEQEQRKKKIKELTKQLKDILCQLDEFCVSVSLRRDNCDEYIDITEHYREFLIEE